MVKSKMQHKLEEAARKLRSAADLSDREAVAYPNRGAATMPSVAALDLRERAQWAREAADVLDKAADGYREVWEASQPSGDIASNVTGSPS